MTDQEKTSLQDARLWKDRLFQYCETDVPIVLVGNKVCCCTMYICSTVMHYHALSNLPKGKCVYISQSTSAHGITNMLTFASILTR